MKTTLIERKSIALLLTGAYTLFSIQAISSAVRERGAYVYFGMPIVTTIAYLFCVYFFIEIQWGKPNVFEKTMAFASAGVFIARGVPMFHIAISRIPSCAVPMSYLAAVLISIATLALAARTIQLFTESRRAVN